MIVLRFSMQGEILLSILVACVYSLRCKRYLPQEYQKYLPLVHFNQLVDYTPHNAIEYIHAKTLALLNAKCHEVTFMVKMLSLVITWIMPKNSIRVYITLDTKYHIRCHVEVLYKTVSIQVLPEYNTLEG